MAVEKSSHRLIAFNVFFALLAVVGQITQNVTLPIWIGSTSPGPNCTSEDSSNTTSGNESTYKPVMGPYFVLSFASFSFLLIFGCITLVLLVVQLTVNHLTSRGIKWLTVKDNLLFPQWQLILIGVFDALNGVFVVYASPPSRTAPFLQATLGNFIIPLTIFFRFILLRKCPTPLKCICAMVVFGGILFSLIPIIAGMDEESEKGKEQYLQQSRLGQILWPFCFMFGFFPAALMNVLEEKSLKDTKRVNLFYLLTWTSLYQLLTIGLLFFVDIIPGFGFVHGSSIAEALEHFGQNYKFALQCFFGGEGCSSLPGVSGAIFIFAYSISYVGGGCLLRYAEGATYLAIVQALVTPLGALFWSIFALSCAHLKVKPHADDLTYFSIAGITFMVPAIFLYNIGTFDELKKLFGARCSRTTEETEPLLSYSPSINTTRHGYPS